MFIFSKSGKFLCGELNAPLCYWYVRCKSEVVRDGAGKVGR